MEYNLLDLIAALEEVVKKVLSFPIGKKSLVDCTEIHEIATEMRLVLPREIQQAQYIVADKNRIMSETPRRKPGPLLIISKAEQHAHHDILIPIEYKKHQATCSAVVEPYVLVEALFVPDCGFDNFNSC